MGSRTDLGDPSAGIVSGIAKAGLTDVFGGLSASIVAIAYGFSYASLIFAPPLTPWFSYGISATFLTMTISAAIMASRSSLPFLVAGPDGATSAVTATLVAALVTSLSEFGTPDDLLAPVAILVAISTALTGLLLCALGFLGAGGAIRYIPFPVIGGFLAATGWLMVSGGVRIVTDHPLSIAAVSSLLDSRTLSQLAAALGVAVAAHTAVRHTKSPFVVPAIVIGGIGAAHLVLAAVGTTLADAQGLKWFFKPPGTVSSNLAWNFEDLRLFPWHALPSLAGELLAMMFVTTITMLLNTNGIEFTVRQEADLERELKTIGLANLLSAAVGGYVACTSLSRTTINYAAGGRGRLSGIVVAAVSLTIFAVGSGFVAYIPKFVLGGLLLSLGATLIQTWAVASARRISRLDYASLLVVALIIVQWGFIAGVAAGVIIGCMTFAMSASRVNSIKFSFNGSEYRSSLDRGGDELAILGKYCHEIQGVILQGYLFFGSADRLFRHVKDLFALRSDCRFLVFDFRLVTGMDSSAMHSFVQIQQAADKAGVRLLWVNITANFRQRFATLFERPDSVADDLDHALETCENEVIARHIDASGEASDLEAWLAQALGSAAHAAHLARFCERRDIRKGEIVAVQGDPADSMHFIVQGRLGIVINLENGATTRVRSLGPRTTIGEMGLITGARRSATIQAEADSQLYILSQAAFECIRREHHALNEALLTYVISVMTERLRFASNLIGVLRRH